MTVNNNSPRVEANLFSILPVKIKKKIFNDVDFQSSIWCSWLSRDWNAYIKASNVYRKIEKYMGNNNDMQAFSKDVANKVLQANVTRCARDSRGLTGEEICQNIGIDQLRKGFQAQLKLSKLGLSSFSDIENTANFLENISKMGAWMQVCNEMISQGCIDKAIEVFDRILTICVNKGITPAEIRDLFYPWRRIVTKLCELDQLEWAYQFYQNPLYDNFKWDTGDDPDCVLKVIVKCFVENRDVSTLINLIDNELNIDRLRLLEWIIEFYFFDKHTEEANSIYKDFIKLNIGSFFDIFEKIGWKLTSENRDEYLKIFKECKGDIPNLELNDAFLKRVSW